MKNLIKLVKGGSLLFLVGAPLYLANQGELGVNLTSIRAIATPATLLIITGLYETFQLVIPATTALKIWNVVIDTLGKDKADAIKGIVNELSPDELVSLAKQFITDLNVVKETVVAIKQTQDDVM